MTTLVPVAFDDPRAVVVLAQFDAEMGRRYPGSQPSHAEAADFRGPLGTFLLATDDDGTPVGCGGLREAEGCAELKKVYVAPAGRGSGLGRRLVRALVEHGRRQGLARVVLQTGLEQPEAIALYESEGFTPIPVYGQYADDPRCRCYALLL